MEAGEKPFPGFHSLQILIFISLMLCNLAFVKANVSNPSPFRREFNEFRPLYYCERCLASKVQDTASATGASNYPDEQDIDIIATYSDTSGAIRISRVKMRDLSASWVCENLMDVHHDQSTSSEGSNVSGKSQFSAASGDDAYPNGQILPTPNLRIFSFTELKVATKNFRPDIVLGEGGFGQVFKCWLVDKGQSKSGNGMVIAVKKLNSESAQGFQ